MSGKSKLAYLNILLNIKSGVYNEDKQTLKSDLLVLKKLLMLECNKEDTQMICLYNTMQKKLVLK